MGQFLWVFTDPSPAQTENASLAFNPGKMRQVEPKYMPIQRVSIAESGNIWVFQLSSTVELEIPIEILDLPYTASTNPVTDGYLELYTFLAETVNWSQRTFRITDADGAAADVRYIRGFETLREAAGRTEKAGFWTGQLTLRRVV